MFVRLARWISQRRAPALLQPAPTQPAPTPDPRPRMRRVGAVGIGQRPSDAEIVARIDAALWPDSR